MRLRTASLSSCMFGWPSVNELAEAADRAPARPPCQQRPAPTPQSEQTQSGPARERAPRRRADRRAGGRCQPWGRARADVNLAIGHALGLLVAHAVHAARLSAANMRHTLRAGPGGGGALGAGGAAGDAALLWAVLQARPAGRCGRRPVADVQRVCALRAAERRAAIGRQRSPRCGRAGALLQAGAGTAATFGAGVSGRCMPAPARLLSHARPRSAGPGDGGDAAAHDRPGAPAGLEPAPGAREQDHDRVPRGRHGARQGARRAADAPPSPSPAEFCKRERLSQAQAQLSRQARCLCQLGE